MERFNSEGLDPKDIKGKLYKLDSSSKILDGISRSSKIMTEKTLREWYTISTNSVICDDDDDDDDSDERIEEEEENKRMKKSFEHDVLVIKHRTLKRENKSIPVFGKELRCFNEKVNISCIEKEIYMYCEFNLNRSDHILKFINFMSNNTSL